ncbi:MAG: hypothetical protein ACRC6M_04370 [Microcystaceae cyanobacterium]
MFPLFKKSLQVIQNLLSRDRLSFESLTIPPKRRVLGVACGTMFVVVGVEQFLSEDPFSHSLFLPQTLEKEAVEPLPTRFEEWIDQDGSPVGRMITVREEERILAVLKALGESANIKLGFLPGGEIPSLILHDTAGQLSREELSNRRKYSHSPLGDGIAVYVPREGEAIVTRPAFFTPYRPTATAYEKGLDVMDERDRNRNLRQVWAAASPQAQQTAINEVVKAQTEKPKDLANRAALWFKTGSDRAFDAYLADHAHQIDGGKTTAIWAIAHLCSQVTTASQAVSFAASPQTVKPLFNACRRVNPLLQASRARLAASMNVEIVQMEGSDCFVNDAEVRGFNAIADDAHKIASNQAIPLQTSSRPAYTDNQYNGIAKLYLKAALEAGRFPQIVTHYWLDQGGTSTGSGSKAIGSHCDPRGFKVTEVYRLLTEYLDHPPETIYGLKPQYGRNPEKGDNVWWSATILGEESPQ